MEIHELKKFFSDRPALNVKQFEIQAGYTYSGAVTKVLNGSRNITKKLIEKIKPTLKLYGYEQ